MKGVINLCITTDINYLKYSASFIASLVDHINPNYIYNLYILTDKEISSLEKKKLMFYKHNNLIIHCISFNHDLFKGYESIRIKANGTAKGNYSYFYRWFIDQYIDADKIIYFDTDMIINGDISDLFNIDLGDKIFGAAKDIFFMDGKLNREFGIKDFFNSGLLLINLRKWKEHKMCQKLLNFKKAHAKETLLFDQDTLNIVGKDDWLCLSPKWNSMVAERFQYKDIQYTKKELSESKKPKVIHYTGFFHRPWRGIICLHPFCFKYFKYLLKTKYRDTSDLLMLFQRIVTSNYVCRLIVKSLCYLLFKMKKYMGENTINFLSKKAFK